MKRRFWDAFRSYKPVGQQARMVTLFMGLFAAAGVRPESKRSRSNPTKRRQKTNGSRIEEDPIHPMGDRQPPSPPPPGGHDHNKPPKGVINQLLDKFPPLNPAWSEELQAKWFEGYQRLLTIYEK